MSTPHKYRQGWTQQSGLQAPVNRALGQQFSNIDELFDALFAELRRLDARIAAAGGDGAAILAGSWTVLTDGDLTAPSLIFAGGEAIAVFVPTP